MVSLGDESILISGVGDCVHNTVRAGVREESIGLHAFSIGSTVSEFTLFLTKDSVLSFVPKRAVNSIPFLIFNHQSVNM